MTNITNYINGTLVEPNAKKYLENINPATGKVYSYCPDSDETDVDLAYQAAKAAFPAWSNMSANNRSKILLKLADLIEQNIDKLAIAESIDQGKPVWLAKLGEIPRAVENIHFFATAIEHFASESHSMGSHAINYTLRKPIGVVGCISPWNLPLYLFTWKIAPALAAGNCVVAKPSEVTPMTAFLFSELCKISIVFVVLLTFFKFSFVSIDNLYPFFLIISKISTMFSMQSTALLPNIN
jgi:aminomuconate-semialdehyde/2-hydroxymuconate-6-semialdehyde dehydrogenase